jgi:hypothetical protein
MEEHMVRTLCAAAATIILTGAALAQTGSGQTEQAPGQSPRPGMMAGSADQGQGMPMMRGGDRRGGESRGGHGMMRGHFLVMMMAMVDTDASKSLSLEEVQAVHARIFAYADADGDGELTMEELRAFMHGASMPAPQ